MRTFVFATMLLISTSTFAVGYLQAGVGWTDSSCYTQCTSLDGTALAGTGNTYNGNHSFTGASGQCICYAQITNPDMPSAEILRERKRRLVRQCNRLKRPGFRNNFQD